MIQELINNALIQPGSGETKIYNNLKKLFIDLDKGSTTKYWNIPKYNGELFKSHKILDNINLSDSLNEKIYVTKIENRQIKVQGIWGLYAFDFWTDINKELLGNIFEKSLSELVSLASTKKITRADELEEQKKWGIFYTSSLLAKFLSNSVIETSISSHKSIKETLKKSSKIKKIGPFQNNINYLLTQIKEIKIIDFSCGSGVFLNCALNELLKPYRNCIESSPIRKGTIDLETVISISKQNEILKSCIHGIDLLPQAVEISKLSLWLTTARKGESSTELDSNFIVGDSLSPNINKKYKNSFDVILGNPPWGGEINIQNKNTLLLKYNFDNKKEWDSWELFILLAHYILKEKGRFGLVLPDTIHSPKKQKIRKFLVENFKVEKIYNLGPDWFGSEIRMGTTIIQAQKTKKNLTNNTFTSLLISGEERRKAITGFLPLKQIEKSFSGINNQDRIILDEKNNFGVFCNNRDYKLIDKLNNNSYTLESLTKRFRGEELNKYGIMWGCPNCNTLNTPGKKEKGGTFKPKKCKTCELQIDIDNCNIERIVSDNLDIDGDLYITGEMLNQRYIKVKGSKKILLASLKLKPSSNYLPPKIYIRQAGVGITATIDYTNSRCPQSVYIYKCNNFARRLGYTEEFILAALVSRTLNYYFLKRFGEVDVARAFTKLTHDRLSNFPIPKINSKNASVITNISELVKDIIKNQDLGGKIDYQIEMELRKLWNLSPEEGAYINSSFSLIPDGNMINSLFPNGAPKRI